MPETKTYECLVNLQRQGANAPELFLFHAPVREVLSWADIDRLETRAGGSQRSRNLSKIRSVKRFLEDPLNTIPTAVVVHVPVTGTNLVQRNGGLASFSITFDEASKPGVVIDGQHRLLGMTEFDGGVHVNVVALRGDDPDEIAFQFLVINNKASRVPTDHIRALLSERTDEALRTRLSKARISVGTHYGFVAIVDTDDDSPFRQMIDWPTNRNGQHIVKPQAIEGSIRDLQERRVRELADEDTVLELFFGIWRTIRQRWPNLWSQESALLSKVGIMCLSRFIVNSIIASYDLGEFDITNLDQVVRRVDELLSYQSQELWKRDWLRKGFDTRAGREAVVSSLTQISRNLRAGLPWDEDLNLVAEEPA